jgi:hypothetical protein
VRLLFTDIQMPGSWDGMDLARQVHARWPNILLVITWRLEKFRLGARGVAAHSVEVLQTYALLIISFMPVMDNVLSRQGWKD